MQTIKFFLLLCLAATLFTTACKKDDDPGAKSLPGIWEGKWGSGAQDPLYFLKFKLESNGQLQRLDEEGQVIASGNWVLEGIEIEFTYTHTADGQAHKIRGLYTDFDGTITGTWGYSPSKANGGNIELKKQ